MHKNESLNNSLFSFIVIGVEEFDDPIPFSKALGESLSRVEYAEARLSIFDVDILHKNT